MDYFNPLTPCGGRLADCLPRPRRYSHFNPLPPCGGRHTDGTCTGVICPISIHSLRVEGDRTKKREIWGKNISIHSLRVEGDVMLQISRTSCFYFNPLPPCGGRQAWLLLSETMRYFNPLPPCGGRRGKKVAKLIGGSDFNPLPPCGGRRADHKDD